VPVADEPRCKVVAAVTPTVATMATAAAEPTVATSLPILRRRARLRISSKVPDGGASGWISRASQSSSGSRSLPGIT
jgi:hypothetical protein